MDSSVLLVIVVAVVGLGVYYYFSNRGSKSKADEAELAPYKVEPPTAEVAPVVAEVAPVVAEVASVVVAAKPELKVVSSVKPSRPRKHRTNVKKPTTAAAFPLERPPEPAKTVAKKPKAKRPPKNV